MTIPLKPATTLTTYHGHQVDLVLMSAIQACEEELGYELTILQGYNPGNMSTSAGTHSYGVVDFAAWDAANKLRVAAKHGFFIWHRATLPGVWPEHLHGGLRNHPGLADIAKAQQDDYDSHPPQTGLVGHATDLSVLKYRPLTPVEFVYPPVKEPKVPKSTHVTKARDALTLASHYCEEAISELRAVKRDEPRTYRDDIRKAKVRLDKIHQELPPR